MLEDVDTLHASGQVKVNGQIWSAKTEEMSGFIAKDTVVMIQGIQGVKLIVKAKEDSVMVAGIFSMLGILILLIVIGVVVSCVRIVRQAQALVIERLGAYQATWGTGLHVKLPIVDRVAGKTCGSEGAGSRLCTTAGNYQR